ncbi:hypothetical protein HBI69_157810 [Parastagonospora nodorum]|nr:hypothetical protein HBI69_157810 [Parastagonospora nodorum]
MPDPPTLTSLLTTRHSTRAFHPTPIPRALLESTLALAHLSPSNSNLQPWRIKILTGAALTRLSTALAAAKSANLPPSTALIPPSYRHHRSALGKQLYGPQGYDVAREDEEGMRAAQLRNYRFFDAPCGVVVYMESCLAQIDVLSVGMWVQSFCLALGERGIACCVSASVAGYGEVIKKELGLGDEMEVLVGVAVGYEDGEEGINGVRTGRDKWEDSVDFMED